MDNLIDLKKDQKQQQLNLMNTKKAVGIYRTAKSKMLPKPLIDELYRLVELLAIYEWGDETIVDDFKIPDKVIIKSGRKEEVI